MSAAIGIEDVQAFTGSPELDEQLKTMVDELVAKKVDDRMTDLQSSIDAASKKIESLEKAQATDRATIVVFSGDFDKVFAALVIATGAASMGMEVSLFFTFWGLMALRKDTRYKGKLVTEKMCNMMMPSGLGGLGTSKMNMAGMGPWFFKLMMKQKKTTSLEELMEMALDLEVKMTACEMSMGIMGVERDELMDGIEYGGVAAYLADAADSRTTLFI